ncbi:MAG TPA: glucose 1-dehydrogenase [Chloroflexota bacterium]|nr:glucose 1-dehydrogenase [Chloroflexota bacterium]
MRLQDKVAVITGGARGIGRGIAHRFAEEGARVVIADILDDLGEQTAEEIRGRQLQASFVHADVSQPEQVEAMVGAAVERHGRLDVLVNNAYWNKGGTAVTLPLEDWNRAMATMVTASFLGAKYAVPQMERQGGGSIISISSVHGILAAANGVVYETAKGALLMLVKEMAVDFGPLGIRVNAICPGLIVHEKHDTSWQHDPFRAGLQRLEYPVRRWGTPQDIANAALYLASDEATFVTGHALVVDGGLTVQLQDSFAQRVVRFVETHGAGRDQDEAARRSS